MGIIKFARKLNDYIFSQISDSEYSFIFNLRRLKKT